MPFNAGEVFVLLGAKLSKGGFQQFDASMKKSAAEASAFEKALGASSARSSKALHNMGQVAKYGAAGGILALGAAVVYSVKKAADFEQQMSALGAVTKANGRQMQQFKKQAMDAGAATKYSALEAAQAQTELAKGGLSVSQIMKGGLKGALALAAAGELDLADAASYTVNALKLFKMDGDRAVHVADALATAANDTTADVQDFGAALTQGGGAARSAGYSFDDTVTILEALAQVGVKNSDAGTSMKTALLQLIGPTKQQAAAAEAAGLSFKGANGEMKGIADISGMLRAKTEDMTKAQRTQLFQTLAGTDGFRTLLALYDAGPGKLQRLEKGLGKSGTAAEVAAKKQDNLKGKLENLQGSLETAAITVGQQLIPVLSDEAEKLTDFVNKAAKSGDLKEFGENLAQGIETAAQHIPDVVNGIEDVAGAAADAAGVVGDFVGVIGKIDPHILEGAALGFAGFKTAQLVAPGIAAVARGMGAVGTAARTAPSVAAFFGDIATMVGPMKLIAGAAVVLGAAIVVLGGHESDETRIAKEWADAKRDQAEAAQAAQDAILGSADAGLAAKRARVDAKQAHQDARQAEQDYKDGKISLGELRKARLADQEASLRVQQTSAASRKSIQDETDTLSKNVEESKKRRDSMADEVKGLEAKIRTQTRVDDPYTGKSKFVPENADPSTVKALANAQQALNKENTDYIQKLAIQKTAQESRDRLMQQSTAITEENAVGVSKLIEQLGGVDAKHQSKLLLDDQGALSKLGNFMASMRDLPKSVRTTVLTDARSATAALGAFKAIQAGIPAQKVTKILTESNSARAQVVAFKALLAGVPAQKVARIVASTSGKAEVDALNAAINALHDKTVTTTHIQYNKVINQPGRSLGHNASGRRAGSSQDSLVGESPTGPREYVIDRRTGEGYITDGPMMVGLGPDDYVIPTEQRYRGRAFGLIASLMRDMGVQGYAKGKGPHKRTVPARIAQGGVPFEDVQSRYQNAKSRLDSAQDAHKQAERDRKQAKTQADKDKADKKVTKTAGRVDRLKTDLDKRKQDLDAARKTDTKVKNLETGINLLADGMELADRHDDTKTFNALKKQRLSKMRALRGMLGTAAGLATGDHKRDLLEQLSRLGLDIDSTKSDVDDVADPLEPEAFTASEKQQLAVLEANLAVAEADTPDVVEGPGEDRDLLTQILGIEQGALTRAKGPGTPPAILKAAAEAVRSTKDQLKGLSTSTPPNDDADLQAQLEQERTLRKNAETDRDLNAAALTAGFGPGGTSGPSLVQNNYMLHPADSSVMRQIAGATMAGVSHSGGRQSPRLNSGM